MACTIDESSLPILTGCPADNELIVVANAAGGLDANGMYTVGYARRYWGDMRKCAVSAIQFKHLEFTIGNPGSPMSNGDTELTITYGTGLGLNITSILQDSIFITASGPEMPRDDDNQFSYDVQYNLTNVIITFNQGVATGQEFTLHFAFVN